MDDHQCRSSFEQWFISQGRPVKYLEYVDVNVGGEGFYRYTEIEQSWRMWREGYAAGRASLK